MPADSIAGGVKLPSKFLKSRLLFMACFFYFYIKINPVMKNLSSLLCSFLLAGLAISCQPASDPDKAAKLVLVLDTLASKATTVDTALLQRIDSLLAEIANCPLDSFNFEAAAFICHETLGHSFLREAPVLARKYYEKALEIRKRIHIADSTHVDILRLYHNLGETYRGENTNLMKALHYYDAADVKTDGAMARVYFNNMLRRGMVLCELGERERSLDDFQRAYLYFQDSLKSNTEGQGKRISEVLHGYAVCYRAMRRYREGLEKAGEGNIMVTKIAVDNTKPTEIKYHLTETADLLFVTGTLWQDSFLVAKTETDRKKAYDMALEFTQKANRIYWKIGDSIKIINCAGNLGALYRRNNRYSEAIEVLKSGIHFSDRLKIETASAPLFINLGYVRQTQKNYAAALRNYHTALERMGAKTMNSVVDLPPLSALKGEKQLIFILLSNIAQTWIDSSQIVPDHPEVLVKAAITYDSLLAFTDRLRGDLISDEAKLQLAKDSKDWVTKAFEGNMQLYRMKKNQQEKDHYLEQAFRIAEYGKAFALLETARLRNATENLSDDLQKEEQALLAALSAAGNNLEKQAAAERRKRNFLSKLEREEPRFFNLKYQSAHIPTSNIRQNLLASDQALMEYFCSDSVLYCFLITPSDFQEVSVHISKKQLTDLVGKFQPLLEKPDTQQQMEFIQHSHALYQVLFAKLEPHLQSINRLIIVPDAPLNNLSFDALLHKTDLGGVITQVDSANFLVFKYAFSYCFSSNLLWEMKQHSLPGRLKPKVAMFVAEPKRKAEVEDLEKKGFGVILENTVTAFWKACTQYAYAHVAAHGIVDENDPGRSRIKFNEHSFLYLNDLYTSRMDQDLVVFSACETAKGRYSEGEGNLSLARGLAYSGVRSFITTHWKIDIDGPKSILPTFYDSLFLSNKPKDVALAEAKRMLLKSEGYRVPSNWAGMVFIGACDMDSPNETIPQWVVWGLILLAVLALTGYVYRRYRTIKTDTTTY